MRVHFVCAGNICRSVIAECVFRARAAGLMGDRADLFDVESGGVKAEENLKPHPDCVSALKSLGIDDCMTTSTRTDEEHMKRSDLVITMTRQQSYLIAGNFPDYRKKCFSLIEINGVIETILENRQERLEDYEPGSVARSLDGDALARGLARAVLTLHDAPRELMRPLAGVPLSIYELMTRFAPCFYQVSGIHDPLGGTASEIEACARQIESEVTLLLHGLLALAASELSLRQPR